MHVQWEGRHSVKVAGPAWPSFTARRPLGADELETLQDPKAGEDAGNDEAAQKQAEHKGARLPMIFLLRK